MLDKYKGFEDLMDRIRERNCHYLKLGWITLDTPAEQLFQLLYDDELWEKAKYQPIDPNNWLAQFRRMFEEVREQRERDKKAREEGVWKFQ